MIENLLSRLARALDDLGIPYMIIGGQAVLLYGSPRLTRDIDITLGVDTNEVVTLKKICRKLRLKMLPKNPGRFVRSTKVLPAEEGKSGLRVDFIFSWTPYENQAIERSKRVRMRGYPVKFASPEDVIIHKIFAGRAIDHEDVVSILRRQKGKINARYVKKWLSEFEKVSEAKQLVKQFKLLSKRV